MPTINKSFLLKLLLTTLVFAGVIFGIHAYQADRIPDALKRQAQRATEAGKPDKSIHYLQQYLEFRPDDLEAQEELVLLLSERPKSNTSQLVLLYGKILSNDPSRHEIRRMALDACMKIGRFSDAITHAETLLQSYPNDSELWQKLGSAQAGSNQTDKACASYETAIERDPMNPTPYQRLAEYYWSTLRRPDDARKLIGRLIETLPHNAEAYLTRARYNHDKAAESIRDIEQALKLDPENRQALLMLAEQLQQQRDLAGAFDCLTAGVQLYPTDVQMVRSLAWLELNRGNIGVAVAVLERGMNNVSDPFDLLMPLADLLVQLGQTDRTEAIIAKLKKQNTIDAHLKVVYLEARLSMQKSKWAQAIDQLADLRSKSVKVPGMQTQTQMLMAICYQEQGNRTAEQETLKLLLSKTPSHGAARVALARSYINEGRIREGIAEYQQAISSPYASASTHAALIRLKMRQYQLTEARQTDWQQLRRVIDEFGASLPAGSSMPVQLQAELEIAEGQPLKAIQRLRDATTQQPGDVELWTVFAVRLADQLGITAGLQVLDEAQAACGDRPDLRLCRAQLHARDPMNLYPIEPLLKQTDTWTDAQSEELLYGMLNIAGVTDSALQLKIYQEIALRRPADLPNWRHLAEAAIEANDDASLNLARQAITQLDPSGKSLALVTAVSALKQGHESAMAVSTQELTKLFTAQPERAAVCITLARLNAAQGNHTEARTLFNRAVTLEPEHYGPIQAYMAYLVEEDDQAELTRTLNRLSLDPVWAGIPLQRAVSGAIAQAPPTGAKTLLDACAKLPGRSAWLGAMYESIGVHDSALREYALAIQENPSNADNWLRLALQQETDDARATLNLAKTKLQSPLFYAMAARYLESPTRVPGWSPEVADGEEQKLFVQTRLAFKLALFDRPGAAQLLEEYLTSDKLNVSQQAWGQRNLAMMLAIRGGVEDRERALSLLAEHPESSGENVSEKRATAAILSSLSRYLDGADRKQVEDRAISVMREILEENKSPRDAFLLAQLYRASGQHAQGKAILNQLLAADPKNLDYHLMALEILTQDGSFKEAESFAERILALYPTTFSAVSAVALYEARAGHVARAAALAEGYLRTANGSAGNLPAKTLQVATLLKELSQLPGVRRTPEARTIVETAIRHYVGLVPRRPEVVIAAAGLLGSDDQYQRAFEFIDQHGGQLPIALKVSAGLAVLDHGDATPRQFDQVAAWLNQAREELPDSVSMQLNQAAFHTLKHEYAAAERLYQMVLDKHPTNVVALNNLAWILAPNPDATERATKLIDRAVSEVGLTGELLDTRARVRIAAQQYSRAESDLVEALTHDKTPLRMFHLALAKQGQSPEKQAEAQKTFRSAREQGLDASSIHGDDLPLYRALENQR